MNELVEEVKQPEPAYVEPEAETVFEPVVYSCIHKYMTVHTSIGAMKFEDGRLVCDTQEKDDAFQEFLGAKGAKTRSSIFKIDMAAAIKMAQEHMMASTAVSGAVSSQGVIKNAETLKAEMVARNVDVNSAAAQAVIAAEAPAAALPTNAGSDESIMRTEAVDLTAPEPVAVVNNGMFNMPVTEDA